MGGSHSYSYFSEDEVGHHVSVMSAATSTPVVLEPQTKTQVEKIRDRFGKIQQKAKPQWLHSGRWLRSGVVRYTDLQGQEREWEMVERTTSSPGGSDGVDVVGGLH